MIKLSLQDTCLKLEGKLIADSLPEADQQLRRIHKADSISRIDLSDLELLDSAGVAWLDELQERLGHADRIVLLVGASPMNRAIIDRFSSLRLVEEIPARVPGFFETIGERLIDTVNSMIEVLVLSSESFYWSLIGIVDRGSARKGSLAHQAYQLGAAAFPIVALLSFIIGFILSLQSGLQLRNFGANIFLADLLSITLVREMGPLVTAIIMAGRSGSAIASEIATMKVTEELDALKVMALNPLRYTVVPKMHAITLVMPILVGFSILFGLLGGIVIGVGLLDMSLKVFLSRSVEVIFLRDIIISFSKSIVFAWVIVIIGSHYGFKVRGGAEGVGKATTQSVVSSIFTVIVIDAIFSLLYL